MKKLAILIAAACTLSFTACELEMYPENKLVNEQALQTFEDLQKFEVGVYAAFRANFTDGYVVGAELQSDYMNAVFGFGNNYGGLHRWDFDIEDYDIIDFWTACYYTIANVNFVLSQKDVITYEDGEAAAADEIFGEMYFMRAMSHYMLIEKFCGNYDASTASKEFTGIPLMTTFDPQDLPSRATLEESYKSVLDDLSQAATLLSGVAGAPNSSIITADAVTALQARVNLQMHNYSEAYSKATSLIKGGNYALTSSAAALKSMFTYDMGSEIIFVFYQSQTELPTQYGSQFVSDTNSNNDWFRPQYIPSQDCVDMFDDADYRKEAFFLVAADETCEIGGNFVKTPVYLMNKYPGNPNLQTTAGVKNYRNAFKVFRIAEMYLIAAEAAANGAGNDAATYLNALRTNRGLEALESVALADVKAERAREMMFEAQRVNDLKRWNDGFSGRAPQKGQNDLGEELTIIERGSQYQELVVNGGDYRFLWPIPSDEIYANQNLLNQQNPGWTK
ncbi:MAG: RagB/SusD family nutrient uptake outer membrane protein [Alistipes sp.]|nr:RagB/SusD family nutrient uptake outer membrane protein [Alistipes sp.]